MPHLSTNQRWLIHAFNHVQEKLSDKQETPKVTHGQTLKTKNLKASKMKFKTCMARLLQGSAVDSWGPDSVALTMQCSYLEWVKALIQQKTLPETTLFCPARPWKLIRNRTEQTDPFLCSKCLRRETKHRAGYTGEWMPDIQDTF